MFSHLNNSQNKVLSLERVRNEFLCRTFPTMFINGHIFLNLTKCIKTQNSWTEAQEYCRRRYTDLASIRNQEDQAQITSLLNALASPVWIGLYRNTWKWSDQANVTSSTQLAIRRFTGWNKNCAGANNYYRVFDDTYCTNMHYFYCNTGRSGLNSCVHHLFVIY
uniref:C-type lectin domain-containing protein n=1 Tax=Cyprinus carpio TaxID=7962 RepID=A0A8C2I112_CYPCA